MIESSGIAMLRALAEQNALRVFAEVVAVTGNGFAEAIRELDQHPLRYGDRCVALYRAAGHCCSEGVEALDGSGISDREE